MNGTPATTRFQTVRAALEDMPHWKAAPVDEVLDILEGQSELVDGQPGEIITRQGEEAAYIYYIVSGEVEERRLRQQQNGMNVPIVQRTLGSKRLVGSLALFYNLAYTGTAKITQPGQLIRISTVAVDRVLYRYPHLRDKIVPLAYINRLRTMPLLASVKNPVLLGYLAEELTVRRLQKGETIYKPEAPSNQGNSPPDEVYLIHQGQVQLTHPRWAEDSLFLGTGGAFGFPGSIGRIPTPSHGYGHWAKATCPTELYVLPREMLRQLAQFYPDVLDSSIQERPSQILRRVTVFEEFTDELINILAGYCSFQHIPQHHLLVQQGDLADSMWILLPEGRATIRALDANGAALPPAPVDGLVYFGEIALVASRNANSTIEAEPGSLWLRLHWRDFQGFLDECKKIETYKNEDLQSKLQIRLPEELHVPQRGHQQYPWLGKGELLVSLNRRHWIALLRKSFLGLTLLVVTGLLALALRQFGQSAWWSLVIGVPGVLALAWGVIDYLNDFFIVTNQRIIQQEKVLFISEQRREALLEQVENVDILTFFWGNILGYGTISASTASAAGAIQFNLVSKPARLKDEIMRERRLRRERYAAESKMAMRNTLERRLGLVVDLPSRVLPEERRASTEDLSQPWYRRLWSHLRLNRQLNWTTTDRIVWRKHWFILVRQIVPLFVLFMIMLVVMAGGLALGNWQRLEGLFGQATLSVELVAALIALIDFGAMAWITVDWWNDTYELTHDRIIDVEKLPLFFGEQRREAQLSEIQDIQLQISSPLEMLLNYGDVVVRTAAQQGAFTFDHVPRPREVKEEINRRLIEWRRKDEQRRAQARMRDMPDWFELYNRLEAGQEAARLALDDETPPSRHSAP